MSSHRNSGPVGADQYLQAVGEILAEIGRDEAIKEASRAVVSSLQRGGRVWIARTTHGLDSEATFRAGGYIAVHALDDFDDISSRDVVIAASPVGTTTLAVDVGIETKSRGATLVVMTTVAFANHPSTILEHPTRTKLHDYADVLVDLGGPIGDGVFAVPELQLRAIPHSGVSGMVAMWMIFSEALGDLRASGEVPLVYECVAINGARAKNDRLTAYYAQSGSGLISREEVPAINHES